MKIIISPAKRMNIDTDSFEVSGLPKFITKTEHIMKWMQDLSFSEAKKLWGCNDKIAKQNFKRLVEMDLYQGLTPAILTYEGLQYQLMSPKVFEKDAIEYVKKHLCILSGFYGVLTPFDGVTPYRLEMQAKAKIGENKDLYEYWGDSLYQSILDDDRVIINLASKEYSKCIENYLMPDVTFITCIFAELINGKVVQKGTMAKMARGEMVRYMAEYNITKPCDIKNFDVSGYHFRKDFSNDREYVFIKEKS